MINLVQSAPIGAADSTLLDFAKSQGFELVGEGSHRSVFTAPHHPGYAFLCFTADAKSRALRITDATYDYSRGEGRKDPFLPRFYGRATSNFQGHRIVMFKTELLHPARPRHWNTAIYNGMCYKTALDLFRMSPDPVTRVSRRLPYDLRAAMEVTDKGITASLLAYIEYMALHCADATFDQLDGNTMQRASGQLVFTDLWY